MLKKSKRISSQEFASFSKGRFIRTPFFDVVISPSTSLKVACVVKKKLFNNAVLRNKSRRIVYTLAQEVLSTQSQGFIFYPKKEILNVSHLVLLQTLKDILK